MKYYIFILGMLCFHLESTDKFRFVKFEYVGPHDSYVWPIVFYVDSINSHAASTPFVYYFKVTSEQFKTLSDEVDKLNKRPLTKYCNYKIVVCKGDRIDSLGIVNRKEFFGVSRIMKRKLETYVYIDSVKNAFNTFW